jgi:hypothetical protein
MRETLDDAFSQLCAHRPRPFAQVFLSTVALADNDLNAASNADPGAPIEGFEQGSENDDFYAILKRSWRS